MSTNQSVFYLTFVDLNIDVKHNYENPAQMSTQLRENLTMSLLINVAAVDLCKHNMAP